MTRTALFALAITAAALPAAADPTPQEQARASYDRGQVEYNLGKFDAAIAEFERAYGLDPDPAYLFNLAQAHRLGGNRERAIYFYRRYLELSPDAVNRNEVEQRIAVLEVEQRAAEQRAAEQRAAEQRAAAPPVRVASPPSLRLAVEAGWARAYLIGGAETQTQPGYRVRVARILHRGRLTFDIGGLYQLTSMPYETTGGGVENAFLSEIHGYASAQIRIAGPLWGSVGLGVGSTLINNLRDGNPISGDGSSAFKLALLSARAELVFGFRLRPTIDVTIAFPTVSVAAPREPIDDEIRSVVTIAPFFLGLRAGL